MSNTDFDFSQILHNIEDALNNALPKCADKQWTVNSFGNIDKNITKEHIQNLIEPNKSLMELGGKRWRPLLLILCYNMAKEQHKETALSSEQVYSLTPLVEFVHTASLIHDDIEDNSDLRRGKPSAYITYGMDKALNAGSWLYFEAPVCINNLNIAAEQKLKLYEAYTQELRRLHLGQAMDIYWHNNPEIFPSDEEYLAMVKSKTGTLASLAATIGCIAGGMSYEDATKNGEIAASIGMGFQIIDDVINLTTGNTGKKRGDDIVERKKSLPILIHAKKYPQEKEDITRFMNLASKNGIESPAVEQCIQLLQKSDCIKEAAQKGTELIKKNCRLFNSREIEQLFLSMIPEVYK